MIIQGITIEPKDLQRLVAKYPDVDFIILVSLPVSHKEIEYLRAYELIPHIKFAVTNPDDIDYLGLIIDKEVLNVTIR